MKKKYLFFGLFLLFIGVLFLSNAHKISAGELYGQVKYQKNNLPAAGIKISIKRKNSPLDPTIIYTNKMGIYSIFLYTGWYTLTCEEVTEEIYIPFSTTSIIYNILIH
jgi:hypothetical protein